jgi:peptide-methionine (R)-S-oxide reductase
MKRRTFLRAGLAIAAMFTLPLAMQAGRERKETMIPKIDKSESEWRQILTPEQFDVLRKSGTERPFSSTLNKQYGEGTYVCAGCDLALFESATKFDSGTGWPSFYAPIEGHTETSRDFKMVLPRTEYHCARCGGHQGHVFNDGPEPTGQRWCNNGVALKFIPANA